MSNGRSRVVKRRLCTQVIDLDERFLQNVITFPPEGGFFVDSDISVESEQRVQFKFSGATFKVNGRKFGVPPFGKGWRAPMRAASVMRDQLASLEVHWRARVAQCACCGAYICACATWGDSACAPRLTLRLARAQV